MNSESIFDKEFFSKLGKLQLITNLRLDQGQSGERKSSAKGASVEFSDFREYIPGDDIRRVDWNAYGRFNKLYIKQFMEEKEAFYHIFLDTSASMNYGEAKKSHMALRVAAVFAYIVQKQLDRVEIFTLSDDRIGRTSPVTGRSRFGVFLKELENTSFEGKTNLNDSIRKSNLKGKGISIIISDFLDSQGVTEAIKYLRFKGQEVLLVQILSKEETEFDQEGTLSLEDMENGEIVRITVNGQVIKEYKETLKKHERMLETISRKYGCSFLRVLSHESMDEVIFKTMRQKGIFG